MDAAILTIAPQVVRDFANLPSEVPASLLQTHIGVAVRDLVARVGDDVSDSHQDDVNEALCTRTLASVFPWLHTFSLSGAAKVGRLEGSVEYRFLDSDDTSAAVDDLNDRFDVLTARIMTKIEGQNDDADVSLGSIGLIAI